MKTTEEVKVRLYAGTYIARVVGKGYNASCTAGPDQAAEAVARKWYTSKATVERLKPLPATILSAITDPDHKRLADQHHRGVTHLIIH